MSSLDPRYYELLQDKQQAAYLENSIVICVTLITFGYICMRQETRQKMSWVFLIQAFLVLGCIFYICQMCYLYQLDTNMTSKNNISSAFYEALSSFQAISFILFAYFYFKISWRTKLVMEGMPKEDIQSRLKKFKIATACLIAFLFLIKTIEMIIQAKYNAQRFLIADAKGADCCHPLQMTIKSLQFIYQIIQVFPVTVLGVSLLQIRNITVQQAKSTKMLVVHFTVVLFVLTAGCVCAVALVMQGPNRGSSKYVAMTMFADALLCTEQVL